MRPQPKVSRRVEDGVLISSDLPAMRMRVEPRLRHIGATALEIKGLAHAERHHFVDAAEGQVQRMLVVQFEGFDPTNEEVYRYRLPDPVTIGGATWGSWVFCYSVAAELAEDPAAETADTVRLLTSLDLALDDEQVMARYARILGDDARHEVLVFYHEPLAPLGHTLRTIAGADGEVLPAFGSVGVEVKARARRAFAID